MVWKVEIISHVGLLGCPARKSSFADNWITWGARQLREAGGATAANQPPIAYLQLENFQEFTSPDNPPGQTGFALRFPAEPLSEHLDSVNRCEGKDGGGRHESGGRPAHLFLLKGHAKPDHLDSPTSRPSSSFFLLLVASNETIAQEETSIVSSSIIVARRIPAAGELVASSDSQNWFGYVQFRSFITSFLFHRIALCCFRCTPFPQSVRGCGVRTVYLALPDTHKDWSQVSGVVSPFILAQRHCWGHLMLPRSLDVGISCRTSRPHVSQPPRAIL